MDFGWIMRVVWPDACAACGAGCGAEGLCGACAAEVARLAAGPRCRRCGAALGRYAVPRESCDACRGRAFRVSRVAAVGPHEGAIRLAIRRLKFARRASAAAPLGRLLAAQVREAGIRADVVVAVPLEPARERRRGFNQAALVAAALAAELGLPLATGVLRRRAQAAEGAPGGLIGRARALLRRIRRGRSSQTALGLLDRAAAVAGAFEPTAAAPAALEGRRVLLVDDVLTTGATLSACADACRAAGARTVAGACVARRIGRRRFAVGMPVPP